jgi:hypothetical protein
MNAIFQFENLKHNADAFRDEYLIPQLSGANLLNRTNIVFQDYLDETTAGVPIVPPDQVALRACEQWERMEPIPERTVWVLDLDATGKTVPDRSYGFCVLLSLAAEHGMNINDFLSRRSFLTAILTLYPERLLQSDYIRQLPAPACDLTLLDKAWPRLIKIAGMAPTRMMPEEIEKVTKAVNQQGAKIILANSRGHEAWLAKLIVNWFNQSEQP